MDDKNTIFALKQMTDSEAAIRAGTGDRSDYKYGAVITSSKFPWYTLSNALVNYNPSDADDTDRIVADAESKVRAVGSATLTMTWCPELVSAKTRARIEEETYLLDFMTDKKIIFAWVRATKPAKSPPVEIVVADREWDAEFYAPLFDEQNIAIHRERHANLAGYTQFFAHANGKPVGRIAICNGLADGSGVYGRIKSLYVAPGARRRGIGAALLDRATLRARDAGCLIIGLLTDNDNPARFLYKNMGFAEIGEYWVCERKIGK